MKTDAKLSIVEIKHYLDNGFKLRYVKALIAGDDGYGVGFDEEWEIEREFLVLSNSEKLEESIFTEGLSNINEVALTIIDVSNSFRQFVQIVEELDLATFSNYFEVSDKIYEMDDCYKLGLASIHFDEIDCTQFEIIVLSSLEETE